MIAPTRMKRWLGWPLSDVGQCWISCARGAAHDERMKPVCAGSARSKASVPKQKVTRKRKSLKHRLRSSLLATPSPQRIGASAGGLTLGYHHGAPLRRHRLSAPPAGSHRWAGLRRRPERGVFTSSEARQQPLSESSRVAHTIRWQGRQSTQGPPRPPCWRARPSRLSRIPS